MSLTQFGRTIESITVIGSGTIGPDIALYFTKRFHDRGVPVNVVDIDEEALEGGQQKMKKKFQEGVENDVFEEKEVNSMLSNVTWSSTYDVVDDASLVVEAATEDLDIKKKIFQQLEERCSEEAILASNSSHYPPERIFRDMDRPERSLVIHYFTPAERNPVVEVAPFEKTDPEITDWVMKFYEELGKAPMEIGSRYGHALNPIFEGMAKAAMDLVEADYGTVKEVDVMIKDALELGVGPLTVMNLTDGNQILKKGLLDYQEEIMPWYEVPDILEEQIQKDEPWPVADRGEEVTYGEDQYSAVKDEVRGALFGLSCEVLASDIADLGDLEMGIELGLDVKAPFSWMNDIGTEKALHLVESFAEKNEGFKVAEPLQKKGKANEDWEIPVVFREDRNDVAVVKIRRFRRLNALNDDVFDQLEEEFRDIQSDDTIGGAVLTGFGRKAFVSGADITRFPEMHGKPEEAERVALEDQEVVNMIEDMEKPVICGLNGLALGGGSELSLGCHARVAREGVRQLIGQPEPNLGIIPGMGGTQRLPRLIEFEAAWRLLRTAGSFSSSEALEQGLVLDTVPGDKVVKRSVELVREAASGERELPRIDRRPVDIPDELPDVDIGYLSEKIDEYLQKAVLEGCRTDLREGLKIEAGYFGKCFDTKDNKIGVQNFLENGPRSKPDFVHE